MFRQFIIITVFYCCKADDPVVTTPLGAVRGYVRKNQKGKEFAAFEGIPYGKAKRFEEPEPVDPWTEVLDATKPTVCAQIPLFQPNTPIGDEDCLHLNVYTPLSPSSSPLDVIVNIPGPGYQHGSGAQCCQPEQLMSKNLILVTINFRVGFLGFLSTEDDVVPGNNGLKDQVLALKWIQNNIASFGGNPKSVTLDGISSGAAATHLHYFSKMSSGLFHKGISASGTALNPWTITKGALDKTKKLGNALNCPTDSNKQMVECLKEKPFEEIVTKTTLIWGFKFIPCVPVGPVVEKAGPNPFLAEDPYVLLEKGEINDVPWLVSYTRDEGAFPVLYYFMDDLGTIEAQWDTLGPVLLEYNYTLPTESWKEISTKIKREYLGDEHFTNDNVLKLVQMFSDRYFVVGGETAIKMQSKVSKSPIYYFKFAYPGDKIHNPMQIVAHAVDLKYICGKYLENYDLSSNEQKMSEAFVEMTASFAKNGKPLFAGIEWEPSTSEEFTYLMIGGFEAKDCQVEKRKEIEKKEFWDSLGFAEGKNLVK